MTSSEGGGDETTQTSGVVDLMPMIRARQASQCSHIHVEVDDTIASLTCCDCGAEIDPWWYLRSQARRLAEWRGYGERLKAQSESIQAQHDAWAARARAESEQLTAQLNHLYAVKRALSNEPVAGTTLGDFARHGAPRRKR